MKKCVTRALRTALQAGIGYLSGALVLVNYADVSTLKVTLVGIGATAVATALAAVMNIDWGSEND